MSCATDPTTSRQMTVLNAIYCPTLPGFTVLSEASNTGRRLSSAPPPLAPAAGVPADSSAHPARVMMQHVRPSGKADCSLQGQKGPNVLLCFSYNLFFTIPADH